MVCERRSGTQKEEVRTARREKFRRLSKNTRQPTRHEDEIPRILRTRSDDGHVYENVQPDLPIRERSQYVAHAEVLLLSDG